MGDRAVIWIPFRGDDGWRDRDFEVVLEQASGLGIKVVVCDGGYDPIPFSITQAWNECHRQSPSGWEKAVMWGADLLLVDPSSVLKALEQDSHWTYAFDKISRLGQEQTLRVLDKGGPLTFPPDKPRKSGYLLPPGGIRVITRELWEAVRGCDERFSGWGAEDDTFRHVARVMMGEKPQRVPGQLLALWHGDGRKRNPENMRLWGEYRSIKTRAAMVDYLERRGSWIAR